MGQHQHLTDTWSLSEEFPVSRRRRRSTAIERVRAWRRLRRRRRWGWLRLFALRRQER